MNKCNVLFFLVSAFFAFADRLHAYDRPVMLASTSDSTVTFWQKESWRPYYYFKYKTDTGIITMPLFISGYDMDSVQVSTVQIDGMGLPEIILSYSMKGGGVDYCEEDVERWHCYKIFNPELNKEIFTASDRKYNFHADNGCGPTPAYSYTRAWTYKIRIDAKGWIYISDLITSHDCTTADKKNGVYVYEFGEYRWHDR